MVFELFGAERVGLLPFQEEPFRGSDRAVDRALAAGTDEDLRRLEELRRPLALPARPEFLVAVELLDRFGFPAVALRGALALDDRERQSVDEDGYVGDDVFLRPEHPVLAGDDPLVVVRVVEVEESDGVALPSVAAVLLQGDAVGEGGVEPLVGLGETGRGDLSDRLDSGDDVGLGEPGVQALEGGGEAAGEDGLLQCRAFWFQVFGREVGVAKGFQEFDRGVLGEVQLVPARWSSASCGLGVGGDAQFAGEEDGHEGAFDYLELSERWPTEYFLPIQPIVRLQTECAARSRLVVREVESERGDSEMYQLLCCVRSTQCFDRDVSGQFSKYDLDAANFLHRNATQNSGRMHSRRVLATLRRCIAFW